MDGDGGTGGGGKPDRQVCRDLDLTNYLQLPLAVADGPDLDGLNVPNDRADGHQTRNPGYIAALRGRRVFTLIPAVPAIIFGGINSEQSRKR